VISLKPRKPEVARPAIVRNSSLRRKVWERDQGICAECGRYSAKWQCDHTTALHVNGADTLENARTLCSSCHRRKSGSELTVKAKTDRLAERHALTMQRRKLGAGP
jgi:5-methylcytosine-specific restriction endonuclease McrA